MESGGIVPKRAYDLMRAERDRLQVLVDELRLENERLRSSQQAAPVDTTEPAAKRPRTSAGAASSSSACAAAAANDDITNGKTSDELLSGIFHSLCARSDTSTGPSIPHQLARPQYKTWKYDLLVLIVPEGYTPERESTYYYAGLNNSSSWLATPTGVECVCYNWSLRGGGKRWRGDMRLNIADVARVAARVLFCVDYGFRSTPHVVFDRRIDDEASRLDMQGRWNIKDNVTVEATGHIGNFVMEIEYPCALQVQALSPLLQCMSEEDKKELQSSVSSEGASSSGPSQGGGSALLNDRSFNQLFYNLCTGLGEMLGKTFRRPTYNRLEYDLTVSIVDAGDTPRAKPCMYPSSPGVSCWVAKPTGVECQLYKWTGGGGAHRWYGHLRVDIDALAGIADRIAVASDSLIDDECFVLFDKRVDHAAERLDICGQWAAKRSLISPSKQAQFAMEIEYTAARQLQTLKPLLDSMPAEVRSTFEHA
eukprot:TRINITY_DN74962_c0_g1_i1.p1 TRINITY_DN74962_c0_g1~~TRINITY_DN74962_c0_g1_i1.p1  ORF type:complete len:480 (+),score=50.55 TRINITY_DN74962_c0_g1_i1:57-1496(+)